MAYKIFAIIVPMVASSLVTLPGRFYTSNKVGPLISGIIVPSDPLISSKPKHDDYFYCDVHGPYNYPCSRDESVSFTYELYSISDQDIIERMRVFDMSNNVLFASNKDLKPYHQGNRNTASFTLPLRDHYSIDGIQVRFELLNAQTRNVVKQYTASFYPPSNSTISGSYLKRNTYTSKSLGFYGDNGYMHDMYETFDFTHFGDYLDVDNYYKLDISRNTFSYPNNYNFLYEYAYLCFNDSEKLFPYYSHQSNGDIMVPLKLVKVGNTISVRYNRSFYINKRTLQISDTYRSGFVITNDFYLPVNGKKKFNGKILYFELTGLGLDHISTTLSINYDTNKTFVGVCTDGDYCVVGGKR